MSKSILDMLEDATTKAENEIRETLQKFHNETGMIPGCVSFEVIDVKTCSPDEPRKVILVSSVNVTAHT